MIQGERPQRVLLHAFSTFKLGGPQARFVQLANAMGADYRHIIVAMDNCFDAGDRLDPGVFWEPLRLNVIKGRALANLPAFRTVIKRLRPDLLLSYNWGAIEWALANHLPRLVPHVHVEDGFGPEEATCQLPRRVWMRRVLLGWNRVPVVVASRNLERIARQIWKLPASRVTFVPNGVDTPPSARATRRSTQESICIGTVAALRPEKNIARLIRAFAQVRVHHPVSLTVVGDGPLRGDLQVLAGALGVEKDVEFTGYLKDPTVRLMDFDLFALSSDTEQLPIALLEAMAAGMPVVATRVGDVGDVLSDVSPDNLCDPDDESFSSALSRALDSQMMWPDWTQLGREKVHAAYSKVTMIEYWKRIFEGQLSQHQQA